MLPRKHKLTRLEVDSLFKAGRFFNSDQFSIKYKIDAPPKGNKFAVIVGKKVAPSSVVRHEIKRKIMAILDKSGLGRGKNGLSCAISVKKADLLGKNSDNTLILQAISGILDSKRR